MGGLKKKGKEKDFEISSPGIPGPHKWKRVIG
jgi:hypothetical protein